MPSRSRMKEFAERYWQERAEHFDVHHDSPRGFVGNLVKVLQSRREDYLLASVPLRGKERILDIGCGSGRALDLFAPASSFAVGLDSSRAMLEMGKRRLEERERPNVFLVRGRAEKLAFEKEAFNVVFALGLLDYLEDFRPLLSEVHRVLIRKGLFALTCPSTLSPFAFFRTKWGNHLRLKWFDLPPILSSVRRSQMTHLLEEAGFGLRDSTLVLATMWIFIAEKQ